MLTKQRAGIYRDQLTFSKVHKCGTTGKLKKINLIIIIIIIIITTTTITTTIIIITTTITTTIIIIIIAFCKSQGYLAEHECSTNWGDYKFTEVSVIWNRQEGHFLFHFSYMKLTLYFKMFFSIFLKKHAIKFQDF